MAGESLVLISNHGAVRTLTLNRPATLNSFTSAMHRELRPALDAAADDASVRCLVITGAGRGFCAGQDLNDPEVGSGVGDVVERVYKPLALRIASMPVPVIAMVNGVAAGAGANFALGCDIVIAAKSASFIQAFSKIGLAPDAGGSWLLPRLVGRARALGLMLTAEPLPAEKAESWGLIWKVFDDDKLMAEAEKLCTHFASAPTVGLALTKRAIDAAESNDLSTQLDLERDLQREAGATDDYAEGVRAFFEKRPPKFTGKRQNSA